MPSAPSTQTNSLTVHFGVAFYETHDQPLFWVLVLSEDASFGGSLHYHALVRSENGWRARSSIQTAAMIDEGRLLGIAYVGACQDGTPIAQLHNEVFQSNPLVRRAEIVEKLANGQYVLCLLLAMAQKGRIVLRSKPFPILLFDFQRVAGLLGGGTPTQYGQVSGSRARVLREFRIMDVWSLASRSSRSSEA
ncbi:hypothetical protein BC834DRAFT_972259 [Gloeopeniophorella convolvens]|nr:hypothetical protein BC834DRAFT_972259 [Gloeopeniophorella convolvens]